MSFYSIDRKRWSKLTIFEQLGNIASEVGRSIKAKKVGEHVQAREAMFRAIDLFDATIEVLRQSGSPKLKEVLRAKEEYLDAFFDRAPAVHNIEGLERYFMQFALAARINH